MDWISSYLADLGHDGAEHGEAVVEALAAAALGHEVLGRHALHPLLPGRRGRRRGAGAESAAALREAGLHLADPKATLHQRRRLGLDNVEKPHLGAVVAGIGGPEGGGGAVDLAEAVEPGRRRMRMRLRLVVGSREGGEDADGGRRLVAVLEGAVHGGGGAGGRRGEEVAHGIAVPRVPPQGEDLLQEGLLV